MKKPVVVVNESANKIFEAECKKLIAGGYVLNSSSCGFVDSEEYDYCNVWNAIFMLQ